MPRRRSSEPDGWPREADELFSVAPADFVRRRDAIARALRDAGNSAAAAEVARLRKLTPVVWTANQVARRHPEKTRRLVEAVERLRRAHLREPGHVAEATTAQRAALKDVLASAREVSSDLGPAQLHRLSDTVMGAAVDRESSRALTQGRLAREMAAPGLEAFAGERVAGNAGTAAKAPAKVIELPRRDRPSKDRAGGAAPEDRRREEKRARDAARAEARAARVEARAARARALELARRAKTRVRAAEAAERAAQKLRHRLEALEQRAAEARRAALAAAEEARRAQRQDRS